MMMTTQATSLLLLLLAVSSTQLATSFSPVSPLRHQQKTTTTIATQLHSTKPRRSRVSDPSGPSPVVEHPEPGVVDLEDIPEAHYREEDHPIPGQPWRRGMTMGCEDPIDAPWRKEAERMIKLAVEVSGGRYVDTTWYLTFVDVTIGEEYQQLPKNLLRENGADVEVMPADISPYSEQYEETEPLEPIWHDEDKKRTWFERDLENEQDVFNQTYAKRDWDEDQSEDDLQLDPLDQEVSKSAQKEYREDQALRVHYLKMNYEIDNDKEWYFPGEMENEFGNGTDWMNTGALKTIGGAIMEALGDVEEELQVIARHKIIMSTPAEYRVLDTQKKFDRARGKRVRVRTQDPWKSNRVLYGVLVERNAMDVYINQKGNMVTVPNNFVGRLELMEDYEEQEEAEWLKERRMDEKFLTKEQAEELANWRRNKRDDDYYSKAEMYDFGEAETEELERIDAFLTEEGSKGKRRAKLRRDLLADWKEKQYTKMLRDMEDDLVNIQAELEEEEEEEYEEEEE